jgi:hypothetical protein
MESIAESGQAFVTVHTARLVEGFFELRDLGTTPVKGSREPIRVYALEGVGAHRTRLDLACARGFSKFVGRGHDMAAFEAALERGSVGSGAIVRVGERSGHSALSSKTTNMADSPGGEPALQWREAMAKGREFGVKALVLACGAKSGPARMPIRLRRSKPSRCPNSDCGSNAEGVATTGQSLTSFA